MEFEPATTSIPKKLPTRLESLFDSRARYLFCKALQEHTPEVLEILHRDVLSNGRSRYEELLNRGT